MVIPLSLFVVAPGSSSYNCNSPPQLKSVCTMDGCLENYLIVPGQPMIMKTNSAVSQIPREDSIGVPKVLLNTHTHMYL